MRNAAASARMPGRGLVRRSSGHQDARVLNRRSRSNAGPGRLRTLIGAGLALGFGAAARQPVRPVPVAAAPAPLPMPTALPAPPPLATAPAALPQPATAPSASSPAASRSGPAAPRTEAPVRTASLALTGLLDRQVDGRDGGTIGHVIDVLVDPDGHPEALLVETGGFLGVGNRHIAIGWADVSFPEHKPGGSVRANMTADEVRSAPSFVSAPKVTIAVGPPPPPAGPPPPVPPAPVPLPMPSEIARAAVPVAPPPPPLVAPRPARSTRFR